jgi:hypothetical protein
MQGEIGSGGVHCLSHAVQMMIYFNEHEVISNLIQKTGQAAAFVSPQDTSFSDFYQSMYSVTVYQLDAHAIFYWAQMPPFQWA